jgi:hypothetical protein
VVLKINDTTSSGINLILTNDNLLHKLGDATFCVQKQWSRPNHTVFKILTRFSQKYKCKLGAWDMGPGPGDMRRPKSESKSKSPQAPQSSILNGG